MATGTIRPAWLLRWSLQWRQLWFLLDADADWVDLESRLIKCYFLKTTRVYPFQSEKLRIVLSSFGNRALMSSSRSTLRCWTPFFEVWIRPASRRIRKWFDSVDFAMSGQGIASVHDMQSVCAIRLLTMRSRIGSARAPSTPANVISSRSG